MFINFIKKIGSSVVGTNVEWGISFFLKGLFIFFTVVALVFIVKYSGIIEKIKEQPIQNISKVVPVESKVISIPAINYKSDIAELDTLINVLGKSVSTKKKL